MSSEAEFERLYQEFVRKGGGALTGTNTPTANTDVFAALCETVNTPASYYNDSNKIGLTPSELAELNAAEVNAAEVNAAPLFVDTLQPLE